MSDKKNTLILTGAGFSSPFMNYKNYNLNSNFLTKLLCDTEFMKEMHYEIYKNPPPDIFIEISNLKRCFLNLNFNSFSFKF